MGMAFQIQDDILDYTRTARTGKPSNNDLREHKVTLPLLTVLESVRRGAPQGVAGPAGPLPRGG